METLTAWIPSLLISLIAVLAFLYLAYNSRSQIDKLQRTLQQNSEQLVESFLQREIHITRHRLQTPAATDNTTDPARWLGHMRRCWLDAELTALMDGGQRHSDYALLQKSALPLLRLTQHGDNKTASTAQPWSSTESKQYLQKTRAAVASQKKLIQDFKARNTVTSAQGTDITALAQPQVKNSSGFISALGNIENNTTTLLETIEKLERELAIAQGKYDVVQRKLIAIETNRPSDHAALTMDRLTISKDFDRGDEESNDLLNELESAYTNSINEMKKMSDINRQQRQLIFQMENELSLLRKDTSEYKISSDVLDKLKLQLRDYENCTTILEMESDTLREQIQNLRKKIVDNDKSGEIPVLESTGNTVPIAAAEEKSALAEIDILELIEHIASTDSLERAGAQLATWLTKQDISSVVYLKGSQEQIWISSEGRVDDHSKQLLKSMMPSAGQPITEVREGVMFIYSVCRVLLYGKGSFHEKNSKTQLRLRDIFTATDHILQLLQERIELRQKSQQAMSVQKKIQSLTVQHNYIDAEHMRTGASFRKEIDEYLRTVDTTEVQKRCIDTMLEDFDSQLEILSKTGKLIATGLKVATQDLAKIAASNTD